MNAITTKEERFQAARWFNLIVGILELNYWVNYGSVVVLMLALLNVGVWAFTRKNSGL